MVDLWVTSTGNYGAKLTDKIAKQLQIHCIHIPLLRVVPRTLTQRDRDQYLHALRTAQHIIFTSEIAIVQTVDMLRDVNLLDVIDTSCALYAVGQSTAGKVQRTWNLPEPPLHPTSPNENSEGLWRLLVNHIERQDSVALVAAANGRELLANSLREFGCTLQCIHLYSSAAADMDTQQIQSLAQAKNILLTSATAIPPLMQYLPAIADYSDSKIQILANSQRIADQFCQTVSLTLPLADRLNSRVSVVRLEKPITVNNGINEQFKNCLQ